MSKIVYITPNFPTIKFSSINTKTLKEDIQIIRDIRNPVDILPLLLTIPINDIKAVIFIFKAENIEKNGALVKILEIFYRSKTIPFFWCSWNCIFASATLLTCISEYSENVLSDNMNFIFCQEDQIVTLNIVKFNESYRIQSLKYVPKNLIKDEKFNNFENLFITFLDVYGDMIEVTNIFKAVTNVLKTKSLKYIKNSVKSLYNYTVVCIVLNLLGEQHFKYRVAQTGIFDYTLTTQDENLSPTDLKKSLICIASSELIPVTKTIVCYETFENVTFVESAPHSTIEKEQFKITKLGTTITLSVDKYFQPKLNIQKATNPNINNAVILCLDETSFSIEFIKNGKLKKTNYNNIPIAIGFVEGKVLIGKDAVNAKTERNSYILTDLVKFMKNDIPLIDPKWGFEITKDENGGILLEFDTFRGRRKATPTFLFAFFLRYSIKAVEAISGQMPKAIVLVTKDLTDYFRDQLMASFKSAKLALNNNIQIHEYKIVEIED